MILNNDFEQLKLYLNTNINSDAAKARELIAKPIIDLKLPNINNPFIAFAVPLFILGDVIKNAQQIPNDISLFRKNLIQHIDSLTIITRKHNINLSQFMIARYLICCYLDEIILNTDWGKNNRWGFESLLSIFYNDTNGGEKFFNILQQLLVDKDKNIVLIELAFVCLKLGFLGKYKMLNRGQDHIAVIEDELYKEISLSFQKVIKLYPEQDKRNGKKNYHYNYLFLSLIFLGIVCCSFIHHYFHNIISNQINIIFNKLNYLISNNSSRFNMSEKL